MTVTVTEFRTRFPEFADDMEYPDERIQLFIDDSINIYLGAGELRWGGKYNYAQAHLVAHLLTAGELSEAGDASVNVGPISSKSAGGVSVTRSVSSNNRSEAEDFYMTTVYGQRFLMIRNQSFAGVLVGNQL